MSLPYSVQTNYLTEAGIRYVCDWVNDDQPYQFEIGTPPLVARVN